MFYKLIFYDCCVPVKPGVISIACCYPMISLKNQAFKKKIQIVFILRISIECNYIPNLSKYKINVRCLTYKVYFLPRTSEINSSMCVDMYVCVCLSVCLD